MIYFVVASLLAIANALVMRQPDCTFSLTAHGSASGSVTQLPDGQNRIGTTGLPPVIYTIRANGGIYDQQGRACITTPPTTQLQCDVGGSPTTGFSIGCDGTFFYQGSSHFVACQTGDNGLNIYTTSGLGQSGCVDITLKASACQSGCPPPAPQAPQACPAALTGTWEYPHLIVPVSSQKPHDAHGTSLTGEVSGHDISSIFTFDIPASDAAKTCTLVFLFPLQSQLTTSSFTISGDGQVWFAQLAGVASGTTSYATAPEVAHNYGSLTLVPGNTYTVATFECPAGKSVAYSMAATTGNAEFKFFQDFNPSP